MGISIVFCRDEMMNMLILLLVLCFTTRNEASQIKFHTFEITSHLPASVCTSTGVKTTESTVKLVHLNGPCSPLNTANRPLAQILSDDRSRVDHLQSQLKSYHTNDNNVPAKSAAPLNYGDYFVTFDLGTPSQPQNLVFDTGSDLTWTRNFSPNASTSYSPSECVSTECLDLYPQTLECGSTNYSCGYSIQYGDSSSSSGILCREKLIVNPNEVFEGFVIGYDQEERLFPMFGDVDGVLGLGRGNLSFVAQTEKSYGKNFRYCLPSTQSETGYLSFGRNESFDMIGFTPFAPRRNQELYYIEITSISVGGTRLDLDMKLFEGPGTIIDSGTVITRLPMDAYVIMREEFKGLMGNYTRAPQVSMLDTCYSTSDDQAENMKVPTVSFTFKGNVTVDLGPSGIFYVVNSSVACFAFAGNGDPGDVVIFGNAQQRTMEVVYDVGNERLGFRPECMK